MSDLDIQHVEESNAEGGDVFIWGELDGNEFYAHLTICDGCKSATSAVGHEFNCSMDNDD